MVEVVEVVLVRTSIRQGGPAMGKEEANLILPLGRMQLCMEVVGGVQWARILEAMVEKG